MPILDIELVASNRTHPSTGSGQVLPANLTQSLADAVARVFGTPQGTVWVKVHIIASEQYAEDNGTPLGVYPVFVTVLKSRIPEGSALENEIARLTQVIAEVLNRPDTNVHIFYQPDGAGRVAFGGKLVK
jgi:phenylpyruvate tautomerase PptA (4-oxalocrotonate tautomerase family)